MSSYCEISVGHEFHGPYHDSEYGFPVDDDDRLFERLMLEINQAGLSWLTILKKRDGFRAAYHQFAIDRVARYGARDTQRLLGDERIIRNRLKVAAAIENAKRIKALQKAHGSFGAWLDTQSARTLDEWRPIFKRTFVFTGGEIVHSFLMSTGYLPGAHDEGCPVYRRILRLKPAWTRSTRPPSPRAKPQSHRG
ncbi:MAG: DNA-3-methyladenine glycosylase I [Gemmatimonadaceae bacterium]